MGPRDFVVRLASICCLSISLLLAAALIRPSFADAPRFAELVQFRLSSVLAPLAGDTGSLSTKVEEKRILMRLSNVSMAGADKEQQLWTEVDRSDLSLISSQIFDQASRRFIRQMKRKVATSILDNKRTDVFEYTELKDGKTTTTEPYVEFKVADFLSVMLIAADAVQRKEQGRIELSMLRDRSVTRVILSIGGEETVGGRPGTIVKVAPPDNPAGGLTYVIARTGDGAYYPARISAQTGSGPVQIDGVPQ